MADIPGTPKKLVVDGNTFFYMADADPTLGKPRYAITPLPHSGGTMHQMVAQDTGSGGNRIKCNGAEAVLLKGIAERTESYPISLTMLSGDVFRCTGKITYENYSAQTNSAEVTAIPDVDWEQFLA
jgi:hypothetical protein